MAIEEATFGPKQYLTLRRAIATAQIADKAMYDEAGKKLFDYAGRKGIAPSGPWSVLYFVWDEAKQKAEIGISIPVEGVPSVDDPELSLVEIPKTKAAMAVLRGPYSGLRETHRSLIDYVATNRLNVAGVPVMAIEEYVVDPMSEPKAANLVTNIYYLHN